MKWFKKFINRKKLQNDNPELKYYCNKCSKQISYAMYLEKKCIWCDSKMKPIIVKEIDKTPKSIKDLNQILIEHNNNSISKFKKENN